MPSKINFIQLTDQEISSKMNILVRNKARIIFWKNSPRYFEGTVVSHNDKLIITTHDLPIKLRDDQICMNFTLNQLEYFIKGKVVAHRDQLEELEISIFDQCFQIEKRDFKRIQMYPYHDAYVYLKYTEEKSANVVFLNKAEQKKNDLFGNIRELEKQKLAALSHDLITNEDEELIGFRVEDLSATGLCFLVSQKEKEHILSNLIGTTFNLHLSIGSRTYLLTNIKIIYQINYIHQHFAGVQMFKIGITFKENAHLSEKVKELIGHDDKILDYQKEFEEFIKNE